MSPPPDLRLLLPAGATWAGALLGFRAPAWCWLGAVALGCGLAVGRRRRGHSGLVLAAALVCLAAGAAVASVRAAAHVESPVAAVAQRQAMATLTVRLSSDPVTRPGRFGGYVLVRGTALDVSWRDGARRTRVPVLLLARGDWADLALGTLVRVTGRLAPAESAALAATVSVTREPTLLALPGSPHRLASSVRGSIRAATQGAGPVARELVPGLVVGDDGGLPPEVVEEFRTAGLTHLTAVSGTNLTLVVGFLVIVARGMGVRGRGLVVVGLLGLAAFVLVARLEPSVVRAAAMGSVALLGMGSGGRARGVRALGAAVLVLLLVDPWLALSPGFVLSVLATAGILFLAPPLRDALMRWLPRWLSEAVAVPLAAQVACTPVVAALSGLVSLVAVAANVLVAPVVGPATVLGLLGGLVRYLSAPAGSALGGAAGICAEWIVLVADRSAGLPTPALDWPTGSGGIALLAVASFLVAWWSPRFLARPGRSAALVAVLVLVTFRPPMVPGWPPAGWVMVACDVGQGDGLVLNAGHGSALVVDAGPDPAAIDRCLRRLRVSRLPVVLLTHFHADHVDGLPGVLRGRRVGEIGVTGLRDPVGGAAAVERWAATAGAPVRIPAYAEVRRLGWLTWQVVGPTRTAEAIARSSGSAANNASLVLVVESRGYRFLLGGDAEPEAQRSMEREVGSPRVDVLKVPHHGSRYQDPSFLSGLGARLAVVSAGRDNDYGHPAPATLHLLRSAGMLVARTDRDGDVAVVVRDGDLRVVTSR